MTPPLWVVIPAAGKGSRFGGPVPKQYLPLNGSTVLEQTLSRFSCRKDVTGIVIAVAADDNDITRLVLPPGVHCVEGGKERADSVRSALQFLIQQTGEHCLVAVHDAARPCVRQSALNKLFAAAQSAKAGAILALPATDTVKQVEGLKITATIDRKSIWLAQTPQVFSAAALLSALEEADAMGVAVTDEASAIERTGVFPEVVPGSADNIKITSPGDLELAEFFLKRIREEGD